MASRFVRLETGRSRLVVFASVSVANANGIDEIFSCAHIANTTGVSKTTVVFNLNSTVFAVARRTSSLNNT